MFFALYDSWRRAQILRKNVSSDALKLFYTEKSNQQVSIILDKSQLNMHFENKYPSNEVIDFTIGNWIKFYIELFF